MADNDNMQGLDSLSDLSADVTKQTTKDSAKQVTALKNVGREATTTERAVKSLLNTIKSIPRSLRPSIKELANFEKESSDTSDAVKSMTDNLVKLAVSGRKSAAGATAALKSLATGYHDAVSEGRKLSVQLDNQTKEYERLGKSIEELDGKMSMLDTNIKKNIGNVEEQTAALEELKKTRVDEIEQLGTVKQQIELTARSYNVQTEAVLRSQQELVQLAKNQRQVNRESRVMEGGLKSLLVPLEELADSQFFSTLENILKGGLIIKGVQMLNNGTTKIGQYYKVNSELATRLGADSKRGFGGFMDASKEAQKSAATFAVTASELNMTLEEVSGIGDMIRVGIKVDSQGKLSEEAVRNLSREVAIFSRVTGIDASDATSMFENRMRTMNMSAAEAQTDIMAMRVQLQTMTVGLDKNNIAMDEMVQLINAASSESQSYVVDTRLMTQAMRAAADQASRLGANQKLAKQTAAATGKFLSGMSAPHLDIPVGMRLMEQLIGDPEEVMKGLTEEQKKMVNTVRKGVMSGSMGKFEGGQILMEQIGAAQAGQEAKMKEVMKYANSPLAGILMKDWGLAGTISEGRLMVENFKSAAEEQQKIEKSLGITVNAIEIMEDKAGKFANAIKDAKTSEEKMAILRKTGLSDADSQKYLNIQGSGMSADAKRMQTTAFLSTAKVDTGAVAAMQLEGADDPFKKFSKGFMGAADAFLTKVTGGVLKGPLGEVLGGGAAVVGGGAAMLLGQKWLMTTAVRDGVLLANGKAGPTTLVNKMIEGLKTKIPLLGSKEGLKMLYKTPITSMTQALGSSVFAFAIGYAIGMAIDAIFGKHIDRVIAWFQDSSPFGSDKTDSDLLGGGKGSNAEAINKAITARQGSVDPADALQFGRVAESMGIDQTLKAIKNAADFGALRRDVQTRNFGNINAAILQSGAPAASATSASVSRPSLGAASQKQDLTARVDPSTALSNGDVWVKFQGLNSYNLAMANKLITS